MAGLVGGAAALMVLWAQFGGELIPVRDGVGYDGATYAGIVRNPEGWILNGELDSHRIQRILPSLLLHAVLGLLGIEPNDTAIIWGFHILNTVLLIGSAYLWSGIARRLALRRAAAWIGFCALFVTYATLKFPFYYPILTDVSGFALGTALLWCFLAARRWLLLAVGLAGAWTWPTVWYSALVLFAVSRQREVGAFDRDRGLVGAAGLGVLAVISSIYAWWCGEGCVAPVMLRATMPYALPLSLLFLGVWVFLAARPLLDRVSIRRFAHGIHWPRLGIATLLLLVVAALQSVLATPTQYGTLRTLQNISLGGATKPGGFLVAHTVYFGPLVPLAVGLWHRIAEAVDKYGPGLVMLMLGYVLLATGSESRKFMNVWPFIVAFGAVAVDQLDWTRKEIAAFALLSIGVSRFWLPLNVGELQSELYFMSMGPRMTALAYAGMSLFSLVTAGAVWGIYRKGRGPARGSERAGA